MRRLLTAVAFCVMLLVLVAGVGVIAPDKARHDGFAQVFVEEASAHPLPIANGYQYREVTKRYYTPYCENGQLTQISRWVETWYFFDYKTRTTRVTHEHLLTQPSYRYLGTC